MSSVFCYSLHLTLTCLLIHQLPSLSQCYCLNCRILLDAEDLVFTWYWQPVACSFLPGFAIGTLNPVNEIWSPSPLPLGPSSSIGVEGTSCQDGFVPKPLWRIIWLFRLRLLFSASVSCPEFHFVSTTELHGSKAESRLPGATGTNCLNFLWIRKHCRKYSRVILARELFDH